eukprot:TRINITY_DN105074_c0_g1_i1.p1 TRINITY_DN105074_c0_g1~~TRINITY_DN105074_c0_g1_i1.p1  ORF type:complete len:110 (+),score=17.44 TRINITY_DN105074_c0_g1_i1:40-330(+)
MVGGTSGFLAGGSFGAMIGLGPSLLTLGLSVPVGAAIGSCVGLCCGTSLGVASGAAGGLLASRGIFYGKPLLPLLSREDPRHLKAVTMISPIKHEP